MEYLLSRAVQSQAPNERSAEFYYLGRPHYGQKVFMNNISLMITEWHFWDQSWLVDGQW